MTPNKRSKEKHRKTGKNRGKRRKTYKNGEKEGKANKNREKHRKTGKKNIQKQGRLIQKQGGSGKKGET